MTMPASTGTPTGTPAGTPAGEFAPSRQAVRLTRVRPLGEATPVAWMLVPSLLVIIVFSWYPAIQALVLSLFRWDGVNPPTFVGLENFQTYLNSGSISAQLKNVSILTIGSLLASLSFPLLAAELVFNLRSQRAGTIYKSLMVVPIAVPFIINVEIWSFLFYPSFGLFSTMIHDLGLSNVITTTFTADPTLAIFCILAIGFPWVASLGFLLYLAGLQTIPHELFDAFKLEHNSFWIRLRHIDLPLIRGQVRLILVLTMVAAAQNFITVLIITNGGPGTSTLVPGLAMYQAAFVNDQYGLGMAIATLMFLVILLLTMIFMRVGRDPATEQG